LYSKHFVVFFILERTHTVVDKILSGIVSAFTDARTLLYFAYLPTLQRKIKTFGA